MGAKKIMVGERKRHSNRKGMARRKGILKERCGQYGEGVAREEEGWDKGRRGCRKKRRMERYVANGERIISGIV